MKKLFVLFLATVIIITISAGRRKETSEMEGTEELSVFVSILPQQFFVEKIGGSRVNIRVMVPPGKSPTTYSPSPRQVSELAEADVFFTIGVPFEKAFVPTIAKNLKDLLIVDTSRGIEKRSITRHSHDNWDTGHPEKSEQPDPHIWMSPKLVEHQADIIAETLARIDPKGEALYRDNLESFIRELEEVDTFLAESLAPLRGETLFVYHPAFGYFADRYGLEQVAIETGGKEPSPAELEDIIEHAREEDVHLIFVQPEFPADSAESVAKAIDGVVVNVAPLSPDYLNNLRSIARVLTEKLE